MPYIADVIHELRVSDLENTRRIQALESTVRHLETMLLKLKRELDTPYVVLDDVSRGTEESNGAASPVQEPLPGC